MEAVIQPVKMVGSKAWKEAIPAKLQQPLANALQAMEAHQVADALKWFGACADIDPFSKPVLFFGSQMAAQAFFDLRGREDADAQAHRGEWREITETLMRAAVQLAPTDAVAIHNLGRFLQDVGSTDEALACYHEALKYDPEQAETWGNVGLLQYDGGNPNAAWAAWRTCISLEPRNPSGAIAQSAIHMREGRWAEGWRLFAKRWHDLAFLRQYSRAEFTGIHWTGQPLRKRDRLLIHGEQGLGDHVQFARWVPVLQDQIGHIGGIETRPVLKRWMQGCFPDIPVYARGHDEVPHHSHHVSMMDLPHLLGAEIPTPVCPSVTPKHLVTDGTKAIGIAWEGAKGNPADGIRSIPTEHLGILADIPNVTWVSLQFTEGAGIYAKAWLGKRVIDAAAEPADTLDTAQVMKGLDHVITVDTLTAHLAGSLNVPTTILHRFCREWRWGEYGEDCSWYPSAQSWTVPQPNAWPDLLHKVRAHLTAFASLP